MLTLNGNLKVPWMPILLVLSLFSITGNFTPDNAQEVAANVVASYFQIMKQGLIVFPMRSNIL